MKEDGNNSVDGIDPDQQNFYSSQVVCDTRRSVMICLETVTQSSNEKWKFERRKRITASQCYGLFTYAKNKNPDWGKKINSYINPKQINLKNFEFGKRNEVLAALAYSKQTGNIVTDVGFFVHPNESWCGCSPDGIVFSKKLLIEIKCPVIGQDKSFDEFATNLPYLVLIDGDYTLKRKHTYFAQIQFSLFILGLDSCDFVVYCQSDDKCLIINIRADHEFINQLKCTLKHIYFTYMLPMLSLK